MSRQNGLLSMILLAGALATPLIVTGCAAHHYYRNDATVEVWTPGEAVYYRQWINERHYEYRDYDQLDRDRQKEYWEWRRTHGDHDHDHDNH